MGTKAQCATIDATFHDQQTRNALYLWLGTAIGEALLQFVLAIGRIVGDAYITWVSSGAAGYTLPSGYIQMSSALSSYDAASGLIHEVVESYYAIEYGIRTQAAQAMDYVAQWFSGEFRSEKVAEDPNASYTEDNSAPDGTFRYGAYGFTFRQWEASTDGQLCSGEPAFQWEVQTGHGLAPGYAGTNWIGRVSVLQLDAFYPQLGNIGPIHFPTRPPWLLP